MGTRPTGYPAVVRRVAAVRNAALVSAMVVLIGSTLPARAAPAPAARVASATGQVTPTGDCTPPNCGYGQWPSGDWRPYSPDSAFNNRIADAAVADRVNSPDIVADLDKIHRRGTPARSVPPDRRAPGSLTAMVDQPECHPPSVPTDQPCPGEDGWPTYYTSASDPEPAHRVDTAVTCDPTATEDPDTSGGCPANPPATVRVPAGAKPNGGYGPDVNQKMADRHMAVVDQSEQPPREYDFWKVQPHTGPSGPPNPAMTVAGMGWEAVTGAGVTEVPPGNATAAEFGNLAGRIRAEELNQALGNYRDEQLGVIRHAITISVECHDGGFVPPALQAPQSSICDTGHAAPMGARLYLPPDFVIDPGWYPWQQVILRTIKQYGMYINDTGAGDVLFNMQKEGGLQYLTQGANNNWYYAASGSYDPPNFGNVQRCNDRGWDGYGDASTGTFFGCVAHFDQRSSLNRVPLDVWTKLRVAALTVDRALRPSSGPVFGGQSVTLHGTGLQETPQEKVQVRFGDAAPVTGTVAADGTSVTVVTPAHASGPVDVTVTSPVEGQTTPATVTLAGGYNYTTTGSPVFTSKSPPTTAPAGSSYRYKCAVTGDLPPRMRWQAGHRTGSRSTPPPERCRAHLRPAPAWPVSS